MKTLRRFVDRTCQKRTITRSWTTDDQTVTSSVSLNNKQVSLNIFYQSVNTLQRHHTLMNPAEARRLANALNHYADECEKPNA